MTRSFGMPADPPPPPAVEQAGGLEVPVVLKLDQQSLLRFGEQIAATVTAAVHAGLVAAIDATAEAAGTDVVADTLF
jgi:hypothetical protein